MQTPRVREVWPRGAARVWVLSGPHSSRRADRQFCFEVLIGEHVGECFIRHTEALRLKQLSSEWVERALENFVMRHGLDEAVRRLASDDGLEIRAGDAADVLPGRRPVAL